MLATEQQRDNFLHEARTAAKLKHPALITVHEVQQDGDLIYIVQEYIEGQNLAQWASAEPRSWEEITRRMIEITTAISYVHQQGFYHRDLKPGNILIDNDGHVDIAASSRSRDIGTPTKLSNAALSTCPVSASATRNESFRAFPTGQPPAMFDPPDS